MPLLPLSSFRVYVIFYVLNVCNLFQLCSPHLCVGFLHLILYPVLPPPRRRPAASASLNFVSHTIFHSHTTCHTQLCPTPSFTHNFVTPHLLHTTLSHTTLSRGLALMDWAGSGGALGAPGSPVMPRHFAWQAGQLATSTYVLRGKRGTW